MDHLRLRRISALCATVPMLLAASASAATAGHAGAAHAQRLQIVTVTLHAGAVSASARQVAHGPTTFIVRNDDSERVSFLVARHSGQLPHFWSIPFVPITEVTGRTILAPGGHARLKLAFAAGHYLLVESQTTRGTPVVANAVTALEVR